MTRLAYVAIVLALLATVACVMLLWTDAHAQTFPYPVPDYSGTNAGQQYRNNVNARLTGAVNALAYTGADIGAKVNAAIANLGPTGGVVEIPSGAYSFNTTIQCPQTNKGQVWIHGAGRNGDPTLVAAAGGTVLNYTGNGDAINDVATVLGAAGCVVSNLVIDGSGAGTAATGFHFGNTTYTQVLHSTIQNFSGATASAVKSESASGMWTERWKIGDHTALPLNKTDINLVCDSGCTSSWGHHEVDVYVNVTSGQTFMNIGAGVSLYGGRVTVDGNYFTGSTAFLVTGQSSDEDYELSAEMSSGPAVMFNIPSGGYVEGHGYILANGPTNTVGGSTGRAIVSSDQIGGGIFKFIGTVQTNAGNNKSFVSNLGVYDPTNAVGETITFGNAQNVAHWLINAGLGGGGAQGNFGIVDQAHSGTFPFVVLPGAISQMQLTGTGVSDPAYGFGTIYTNGTKPAASGNNHYRICVSDATACTSGTTYASGGGTACELWSNNTNWIESGSGC